MKCVILAGGRGTRISEESHLRPKPMIEIGSYPIMWHIMKIYAHHGVQDFIVCLGYRGYMVKEYFANYRIHNSDITVDLRTDQIEVRDARSEPWRVTLVDTGEGTNTAGRVRRVRRYLDAQEPFYLTYGDGLADIDLTAECDFHRAHGRLVTMTVVRPPARYGASVVEGDRIVKFVEKSQASEGLINGGFFIMSPDVLDIIEGDSEALESTLLVRLVERDQLRAWRHDGFWQPMDTLRERELLEGLWAHGSPPWKVW